ncbi:MAG: dephospho-CoA kinase [Peptostreptococcaceae bacterium]|jgi:dephospho-CoA kinase|nr:dephospho-CoA kinase [Peptostreptococcaceae bacterium]
MLFLGLTGSIGTGKSTVSKIFKEKNIDIIDADYIAKKLLYINELGYAALIKEFGLNILADDKSIDKKKLKDIVFNDENKRLKLNSIMHPLIINKILVDKKSYEDKNKKMVILDAPLLFETKLNEYCDFNLVITCKEEIQIQRIKKRDNMDEELIKNIIKRQMPQNKKRDLADYYIDNSFDYDSLEEQINRFLIFLEERFEI